MPDNEYRAKAQQILTELALKGLTEAQEESIVAELASLIEINVPFFLNPESYHWDQREYVFADMKGRLHDFIVSLTEVLSTKHASTLIKSLGLPPEWEERLVKELASSLIEAGFTKGMIFLELLKEDQPGS